MDLNMTLKNKVMAKLYQGNIWLGVDRDKKSLNLFVSLSVPLKCLFPGLVVFLH